MPRKPRLFGGTPASFLLSFALLALFGVWRRVKNSVSESHSHTYADCFADSNRFANANTHAGAGGRFSGNHVSDCRAQFAAPGTNHGGHHSQHGRRPD